MRYAEAKRRDRSTDRSKVVIGTWPLSGDYGLVDLRTVQKTLEYCYQVGIREFDTAPSYGNGFAEFCLGNVFRGKSDLLINTKVGNAPFRGKNFSPQVMEASFDASLKRLGRNSVDTLFLHNPRVDNFRPLLDFLEKMKRRGKIGRKGISLARNFEYRRKLDLHEFDVVQYDANLLSMEFLDFNLPNRIEFMARSALANGLLTGNFSVHTTFPAGDVRSEWLRGERLISLLKRVDAIREITRIRLPSLARRFVLQNKRIDKVVFGVKRRSHVDDILRDLNGPALGANLVKRLIQLYENDFWLVNERHLGY